MDSALLSLVSACTALVASIAGPFVTLMVAKRNFNATVLSANRQKWIETLRDMLAELISLLIAALVVKGKWKDKWDRGRSAVTAEPGLLEKVQRLVLAQTKIRLLLNPSEAYHQQLFQAIETATKRLQSEGAGSRNRSRYRGHYEACAEDSQARVAAREARHVVKARVRSRSAGGIMPGSRRARIRSIALR